jgi:hypothetical protein
MSARQDFLPYYVTIGSLSVLPTHPITSWYEPEISGTYAVCTMNVRRCVAICHFVPLLFCCFARFAVAATSFALFLLVRFEQTHVFF